MSAIFDNLKTTKNESEFNLLKKKLKLKYKALAIVGFVGLFVCFSGFTITGFVSVSGDNFGFPPMIIVFFLLFMPCVIFGAFNLGNYSLVSKISYDDLKEDESCLLFKGNRNFTPHTEKKNKYCTYCGMKLSDDDVKCPYCGAGNKK